MNNFSVMECVLDIAYWGIRKNVRIHSTSKPVYEVV